MAKKIPSKKAVAKKKATVPKKKAVKKAVTKSAPKAAPKTSIVDEAMEQHSSTFSDKSTYTQPAAKQDGKRFPLVLIVLLVIGVIVFLNYLNKKKSAANETATVTTTQEKAEKPVAETSAWDKAPNAAKDWKAANSACEKKGMKLPTKEELTELQKSGSKEVLGMGRLWSSTAEGNDYVTVFMKSGNAAARPAGKTYKSLCKK